MSIAKVAQVGELPLALLILGGASGETTGRPALIMGRAPGRAIKVERLADATGTAKLLQGFEALRFVSRAVAPGDGGGRSIRRCRWWWSLGDGHDRNNFSSERQDSGHGEKIHAAREGHRHPHSGRAGFYRCRSTACWVSSRVVKANRGHRFSPPSSQRCSHMRLYIQHPGRAKTVARQ